MEKNKIDFAKCSLTKSCGFSDDKLIEFIILWVGFNALYDKCSSEKLKEKEKIQKYFNLNKNIVEKILTTEYENIKKVVNFIKVTSQHEKLNRFLKNCNSFTKKELNSDSVIHFEQFVRQIRNNLFHAGKVWNQKDEEKLLELFNPVMRILLKKFIENEQNLLKIN